MKKCSLSETALPVSRQVVVQHGASNVHGVRPLADNDAVAWQQLGNVMKHCVVIHGYCWLEGERLWIKESQWVVKTQIRRIEMHQMSMAADEMIQKL